MAFIEPMHRNKPNITYLLTQIHYLFILYLETVRNICNAQALFSYSPPNV